jgi:hypothetical protein
MAEIGGINVTVPLIAAIQTSPGVSWNGGRTRSVVDRLVQLGVVTAIADTVFLARLPSHSVIHHGPSFIAFDALGGTTGTFSIGTRNPTTGITYSGVTLNASSINSAINFNAASQKTNLFAAHSNNAKRLFEIAGLTTDPRQPIDIYMTVVTAATTSTTGNISWGIYYSVD